MKTKLKQAYMKTARTFAGLSHARRLHVGAIVVKDDRIISIGYNGMPAGWDNNCEDKFYSESGEYKEQVDKFADPVVWRSYDLKTKQEVLHAESNSIAKLARSSESAEGATMFITHSPCIECAKLIYQSGISRVYYAEKYRDDTGINFLKASDIEVSQIEE